MIKLSKLLKPYTNQLIDPAIDVRHLTNKSSDIAQKTLFLAEKGIKSHGLDYLNEELIEKSLAICWQPPYSDIERFNSYKNKFIPIENLSEKIGFIARDFYCISNNFKKIAVTGTNGKTSVSYFISQLTGYSMIGTIGYGTHKSLCELENTTPDALTCQKLMADLSQISKGVCMEVSSHALIQERVSSIDFETAIFTNISQDHLDYHQSMKNYFLAKKKLFEMPSVKNIIINIDDPYANQIVEVANKYSKNILAYGQSKNVTSFDQYILFSDVLLSNSGIICNLEIKLKQEKIKTTLSTPIWGTFNLYNLSAAILAAYTTGFSIDYILKKSIKLKGVLGRIEPIYLPENKTVIIDYSHTPDALKNVLESLKKQTRGNIYTVFGCGGDRDTKKRPLMAEVVNKLSSFGIVTNDNPRTESPKQIIDDIYQADIDLNRFKTILDRREAIQFALNQLNKDDTLLIAGKGHETYQLINNNKIHFSDHEVVEEWIDAHI